MVTVHWRKSVQRRRRYRTAGTDCVFLSNDLAAGNATRPCHGFQRGEAVVAEQLTLAATVHAGLRHQEASD